jgi:hypothetical protein
MRTRRERKLRLGLAGAVSMVMIVMLGAFGGLGYAKSSMKHAVKAATHVVDPATPPKKAEHLRSAKFSSAAAQYGKKQAICTLQPNGKRHTIVISVNAVPHYLATHPGATLGPCA